MTGETSQSEVHIAAEIAVKPEALMLAVHFQVCTDSEENPDDWNPTYAYFGTAEVGHTTFVAAWMSKDGKTMSSYSVVEIAPLVAAATTQVH